jgi:hypothetical protein
MILDMKGGAISMPLPHIGAIIAAPPYGRTTLRPTPQSAAPSQGHGLEFAAQTPKLNAQALSRLFRYPPIRRFHIQCCPKEQAHFIDIAHSHKSVFH